jgi:pyruvate dehydrogenase complex dehydrogenase (E1) component
MSETNDVRLYRAVAKARSLVVDGFGLADGARIAAAEYRVDWRTVMGMATRAHEACTNARDRTADGAALQKAIDKWQQQRRSAGKRQRELDL